MRIFYSWWIALTVNFALLPVSAAAEVPLDDLGIRPLQTAQVAAGRVGVRFMGTSTILLDDGTTQILIDGFFSRPNFFQLAGTIASDAGRVERAMSRAGISNRLRAVLVAHSHYDHALDAPAVADKTGARLVGSLSTANIGRGAGLPDSQIDIVRHGQTLRYGEFIIVVLHSHHGPNMQAEGEITTPLVPPARAEDYREGGSYSFLVKHKDFRILIHPSAGVRHRLYRGILVDVVFLGIGGLEDRRPGPRPPAFQRLRYTNYYWSEVVGRTRARLVIPIHWDAFTRPLDDGLWRPSALVDDVSTTVKRLQVQAQTARVQLRTMPLFDPVDIKWVAGPRPSWR